ncbi:hypothetical protein V5G24_00245 [Xanthobacter sp. VTT E-85241]
MIRRGWSHTELMGMSPGDFAHWLDIAVTAAKAEAEAMKKASKG